MTEFLIDLGGGQFLDDRGEIVDQPNVWSGFRPPPVYTAVLDFAVKVFEALDLIKTGPSAMETAMTKLQDHLDAHIAAAEETATLRDLRDILEPFSTTATLAQEYVDSVASYPYGAH